MNELEALRTTISKVPGISLFGRIYSVFIMNFSVSRQADLTLFPDFKNFLVSESE
ncbi:hypothetical protein LEP1GSC132_1464 [Leptospira kirschneri str. 200803703]|uniref:Uncharacterized protein n=1 Tax=Leptospira kirschneri str. 200802841 TaxID=1193047 RepID=A0A828Y955_9LEPT|nr:hypothetical protein LEP1GSC131_4160 [Leptospira kirschneri str. 200802841]EMO67878.1 hypothetical protein LEP1GSC132_1464 [Leptospira kirschneri str. 200803703]EMO77061.1 hypothetical protein LEP1GSC127_0244 [Leptospira kirschneri str. 200801925]